MVDYREDRFTTYVQSRILRVMAQLIGYPRSLLSHLICLRGNLKEMHAR